MTRPPATANLPIFVTWCTFCRRIGQRREPYLNVDAQCRYCGGAVSSGLFHGEQQARAFIRVYRKANPLVRRHDIRRLKRRNRRRARRQARKSQPPEPFPAAPPAWTQKSPASGRTGRGASSDTGRCRPGLISPGSVPS